MLALSLSRPRLPLPLPLPLLLPLLLLVVDATAAEHSLRLDRIVAEVHRKQAVQTLLVMRRAQDLLCPLQDIQSLALPSLHGDERTAFDLRARFNSEALAVVCISELVDYQLLSRLAQSLDRMRDARIIVLLRAQPPFLADFQRMLCAQADTNNFVKLLLLHAPAAAAGAAYRLQPFPNARFEALENLYGGPIFPTVWQNFMGRNASYFPDLIPPRSFSIAEPRTGRLMLGGSADIWTQEFAKTKNISLRMIQPGSRLTDFVDFTQVYNLTKRGLIDLPTRGIKDLTDRTPHHLEHTNGVELMAVIILVPCAKEMHIGNVYSGLKTYSAIIICSYFLFALIDALLSMASQWVYRCGQRIPYPSLLVNLRVFTGILGLPIPLRRRTSSGISLRQFVMVLYVFGVVLNTFFNASLRTLLTKHPQNKQIETFEELRQSGIQVLFDIGYKKTIAKGFGMEYFERLLPNAKFVSTTRFLREYLSLNSSYAYYSQEHIWQIVDLFQKSHHLNVLCKSERLKLMGRIPVRKLLKRNSVFKQAYTHFQLNAYRFGLSQRWTAEAGRQLRHVIHLQLEMQNRSSLDTRISMNLLESKPSPLTFQDLRWLWKLLAVYYAVAGLVLAAEICVAHFQRRARSEVVILEFIM